MIDDVYNSKILELAGNIPRLGRLDDADATAMAHSKLCGSKVTVWLKTDDGIVTDFAHDVKACNVIGATADEVRKGQAELRAMLKDNGPAPSGRFSDLKYLEPVRDYKARHASTLLTFDAVVDALDQIAAKRANEAAA
jgi:NifU-like protein involved in Fe-S cluster formation